jgi:hypothetical protein
MKDLLNDKSEQKVIFITFNNKKNTNKVYLWFKKFNNTYFKPYLINNFEQRKEEIR